jgi:hypothetical protein
MVEIKEGVLFVAFNCAQQIAVDSADNIWTVDGWFDAEGDELDMDDPNDENSNWPLVEAVTCWSDHLGDRVWGVIRPDDFDRPTEG